MDEALVQRVEVAIEWAEEGNRGQVYVQLDHEPTDDVDARALSVWGEFGLDDEPTAVLLFISMVRREVRIVGGTEVAHGFDADTAKRIVKTVIDGFRRGQSADGLEAALRDIGGVLRRVAPA